MGLSSYAVSCRLSIILYRLFCTRRNFFGYRRPKASFWKTRPCSWSNLGPGCHVCRCWLHFEIGATGSQGGDICMRLKSKMNANVYSGLNALCQSRSRLLDYVPLALEYLGKVGLPIRSAIDDPFCHIDSYEMIGYLLCHVLFEFNHNWRTYKMYMRTGAPPALTVLCDKLCKCNRTVFSSE